MLVAAVAALGILAALAVLLMGRGPSELQVEVVRGAGPEQLKVLVREAPEGTLVRLLASGAGEGVDRELVAGSALLPLGDLAVGSNALPLELHFPDGEVESTRATVQLDYRVRADVSGLGETGPGVDILFEALPGTTATLGGEEVKLDVHGRGRVRVPVQTLPGGTLKLKRDYRLGLPGGQVASGQVRVGTRVTPLTLRGPGVRVMTDAGELRLEGESAVGANVQVEGNPVVVDASGGFSHRVKLGPPGLRSYRIVSEVEGMAPAQLRVEVERVSSIQAAALGFQADAGLDYLKLADNPGGHAGKAVSFDGTIYSARSAGGRSELQMLTQRCRARRPRRCPLWVTSEQVLGVSVGNQVRVLGNIDGVQSYVSKGGKPSSMPRVKARFVLPLDRP